MISIFFDGSCGLCRDSVQWIRRLDWFRRVVLYDLSTEWDLIRQKFPKLDHAACFSDMHAVTAQGRVAAGFYAYRELAKVLPAGWLLLPILYFPGVAWVGRAIYRRIAQRRQRSGCAIQNRSGAGHSA